MERILNFLHLIMFFTFLFIFLNTCTGENVKKSAEDNHDDDFTDDLKGDLTLTIPVYQDTNINETSCSRRKNSQMMHEIRSATHKQFPFMVAIMSARNEYVCAGSIISNGLILTTAQCTESISHVLMNTTNDKKDNNTISLHIIKSEKFPTYTGSTSIKNAAIIYTEKHNNTIASKISLSNHTFSQELNDIEALGFGLNADVGQLKELQYVGLDSRMSNENSIKGFIDCIDTKVPTCFKDKGGPLIVKNELIGLITKGQDACTKELLSTYAINKHMVEALPIYTIKPWLDEIIAKQAKEEYEKLETFPNKPVLREAIIVHKMTSAGYVNKIMSLYYVLILLFINFNI